MVGLGGCKTHGTTLDCCEYDITVFDDKSGIDTKIIDGILVQIHHGKINETDPDVLQKYESMQILSDPSWSFEHYYQKQKKSRKRFVIPWQKKH